MRLIIGVFLVVLADQVTKIWVSRNMELMESIPVIPGIFHITFIQNPASSFGILKFDNIIFIAFGLLVILFLILFLSKMAQESKIVFYSFIFIIGGALGNLLDRIRLGSVIDFLDFRIWPIFNIADSAINVGLFLLIIHFLFHKEEENNGLEE